MGYQGLLKDEGLDIIAWETFGDYQGDYAAVLKKDMSYGFVVIGYGSCTGCDSLQALQEYNYDTGEYTYDSVGIKELTDSIIRNIFWGTADEVRAKITNQYEDDNNWYRSDEGYKESVDKLCEVLK